MRAKIRILRLSLTSAALLCLTACQTTSPPFPVMHKEARAEIVTVCGDNLEHCPETERWLGKIEKLKRQLEN